MRTEQYFYPVLGTGQYVCIQRSRKDASRWEIRIDELLVSDGYRSEDDAAEAASRKDFGDSHQNLTFARISVPSDIHRWMRERPEGGTKGDNSRYKSN